MLVEWQTASLSSPKQNFTFSGEDYPATTLTFPIPPPTQTQHYPSKRIRPRADVDGEGSEDLQKKKRRLRLDLITSRLSSPFATPTTHIVTRGAPKVLIKGRQQVAGVNGLRKAAIMNSIRRKDPAVKRLKNKHPMNFPQCHNVKQANETETEVKDDSHKFSKPDISEQHRAPTYSSLGLSDYDALDEEDDDLYEDEYQDETDYGSVYGDFDTTDPIDDASDDYDFSIAPSHAANTKRPQKPPSEEITDLIGKEDGQEQLFYTRFGA